MISWSWKNHNNKWLVYMSINDKEIRVPELLWKLALAKNKVWKFVQKWLLNRTIFTFSNGSEFDYFLDNCRSCKYFDERMLQDSNINTCNPLHKILDQMAYEKKQRPDLFRFKRNEFNKCEVQQ